MIAPLVRFEVIRRVRRRPLALLLVLHPAAVALAYRFQPAGDPVFGDDVSGLGTHLVWLFLISFEIGRDRELGLDALIAANLARPAGLVTAKALALGIVLAAYHGALLLVSFLFAPDPERTLAGLAQQIALVPPLLPLVLAVELLIATRIPMAYVAVTALGGLLVAFWSGLDAETIAAWSGSGEGFSFVRPVLLGLVGLAVVGPLAIRRVAGRRPF